MQINHQLPYQKSLLFLKMSMCQQTFKRGAQSVVLTLKQSLRATIMNRIPK